MKKVYYAIILVGFVYIIFSLYFYILTLRVDKSLDIITSLIMKMIYLSTIFITPNLLLYCYNDKNHEKDFILINLMIFFILFISESGLWFEQLRLFLSKN